MENGLSRILQSGTWSVLISSFLFLTACERRSTIGFGDGAIEGDSVSTSLQTSPQGRSSIRRLNNREFANSLTSLFGSAPTLSNSDLPTVGRNSKTNFDTDGSAQFLFGGDAESYLDVIQKSVNEAFARGLSSEWSCSQNSSTTISTTTPPAHITSHFDEDAPPAGSENPKANRDFLPTNGEILLAGDLTPHPVNEVIVYVKATPADGVFPHVVVKLDNQTIFNGMISSLTFTALRISLNQTFQPQSLSIRFDNNIYIAANNDRNLWVSSVELIERNQNEEVLSRSDCTAKVLSAFLKRAFRRPLTPSLLQKYRAIADAESSYEEGLKKAFTVALLSPNFMFIRSEDQGTSPGELYQLNDFELAERLAFMLWGSIPDTRLLDLAEEGRLSQADILRSEILRMKRDSRFKNGFIDGFVRSWLNLNELESAVRDDATLFPSNWRELIGDMQNETSLFLKYIADQDRPFNEILEADYSFLNSRLRTLYGMNSSGTATDFVKTPLPSQERRGLLTQASLMTVTGNGTELTNPIKRGYWLLKKVICKVPPPVPDEIPSLPKPGNGEFFSPKEVMALHSSSPSCAGCHMNMDPIGVGLENFDNMGRFRTHYPAVYLSQSIDASHSLFGSEFNGPTSLSRVIDENQYFGQCLTKHLTSYGIGRQIEEREERALKEILQNIYPKQSTIEDLLVEIAMSQLFNQHRMPKETL